MRTSGAARVVFILLFVGVLAAALTAVNLRFTRSSAGGNDFLPRWLGTRLFIMQHQSPYSPETTAAIQTAMYGRDAEGDEDQALFAYPLYAMLVFAPFSAISDYTMARAVWITAQEMALMGTALAAIALAGWKPGRGLLATFLFFALAWFHAAKPLVDGNASIMVALLVTLALLALKRNQDGLAGVLLAAATIKPQMVVLVIVFILLWSLSKKRRGVLWGFAIALVILVGGSLIIQRDWLAQDIAQVLLYGSYSPPGTLVGALTQWWGSDARLVGIAISAGLGALLLYEWWRALGAEYESFLWAACLTLVMGPLVGLPSTTSNYSIFLAVLAFIFYCWQRRINSQRAAWMMLAVLFIGIWAAFLITLQSGNGQFREHIGLLFVAPVFLFFNLYWLRGWVGSRQPS
jgi:hypothetical protein